LETPACGRRAGEEEEEVERGTGKAPLAPLQAALLEQSVLATTVAGRNKCVGCTRVFFLKKKVIAKKALLSLKSVAAQT
jgi:hypothetical protein